MELPIAAATLNPAAFFKHEPRSAKKVDNELLSDLINDQKVTKTRSHDLMID